MGNSTKFNMLAFLYRWIKISGYGAAIFLLITFLIGVLDLDFLPHDAHEIAGILTFVFAALHVGLIFYRNYLIKHPKPKISPEINKA